MSFLRKSLGLFILVPLVAGCAGGETGGETGGGEGGSNGAAGGGQGGAGQGGGGAGGGGLGGSGGQGGGQGGGAGQGGAGQGGNGGAGGGSLCYTPASSLPFDRTCAVSADCNLKFHMIDCCGTLAAVGIQDSDAAAFDAAEAMCQPICDCVAKPTVADDGKTSADPAAFQVSCVAGMCTTSVP